MLRFRLGKLKYFKPKKNLFFFFCLVIFILKITSVNGAETLPLLQVHPLPSSLLNWQDDDSFDNYFEEIQPSPMGYLIWTEFPVKIYVESPMNPHPEIASDRRFLQWEKQVLQAVSEWNQYLPLTIVDTEEIADIKILRSSPPLGSSLDPDTGKLIIPPARTAQTRYQFIIKDNRLTHQMTIQISPQLSDLSLLSASRHELGHGLGIWGHSPVETDALYFSQVRHPPAISSRDINTLKKIYQQPTRLGGKIP